MSGRITYPVRANVSVVQNGSDHNSSTRIIGWRRCGRRGCGSDSRERQRDGQKERPKRWGAAYRHDKAKNREVLGCTSPRFEWSQCNFVSTFLRKRLLVQNTFFLHSRTRSRVMLAPIVSVCFLSLIIERVARVAGRTNGRLVVMASDARWPPRQRPFVRRGAGVWRWRAVQMRIVASDGMARVGGFWPSTDQDQRDKMAGAFK